MSKWLKMLLDKLFVAHLLNVVVPSWEHESVFGSTKHVVFLYKVTMKSYHSPFILWNQEGCISLRVKHPDHRLSHRKSCLNCRRLSYIYSHKWSKVGIVKGCWRASQSIARDTFKGRKIDGIALFWAIPSIFHQIYCSGTAPLSPSFAPTGIILHKTLITTVWRLCKRQLFSLQMVLPWKNI